MDVFVAVVVIVGVAVTAYVLVGISDNVAIGVHRAYASAGKLADEGISASVLNLRMVSPFDKTELYDTVSLTGQLLVVDEDYEGYGHSGELAAVVLEAGILFKYSRVSTQTTIPYARNQEDQVLPNIEMIRAAVKSLLQARD